jgi:hypothetical protein
MTDKQNTAPDAASRLVSVEVGEGLVRLPEALAGQLGELEARFAECMGEGLMAASVAVGLDVLGEMMGSEVAALVGPKGRHDPERSHVRHGSEAGSVTLGGRRVGIRRPRVRSVDGNTEATLEMYRVAKASDLLAEHMVGRCWRACRPAGIRRRWSRSVLGSKRRLGAPRSRRCRVGSSTRLLMCWLP